MTQTRQLESLGLHLLPQSRPRLRRGVTLIELLVVMAIITALGLLALMMLPGINNSDAALKATEEVRATCKVAQALAAGARQPRGVRFLYRPGVPLGQRHAMEMQLIESPPIIVFDPTTLVAGTGKLGGTDGVSGPRVDIFYDLSTGGAGAPAAGTITNRHCQLVNLTQDQKDQIKPGALLVLPTLGFWSRINSLPQPVPNPPGPANAVEVVLDFYPDTFLGASTAFRTYHGGIFGTPVPLLGQPTIPLPNKTAVDLDISVPPTNGTADHDIMFAPDGQTIAVAGRSSSAGVYLWVRDITKIVNANPVNGGSPTSMVQSHYGSLALWADSFRKGGEHHAVGISNGYVGSSPIQWPDVNGNYNGGDPFTFARKRLN